MWRGKSISQGAGLISEFPEKTNRALESSQIASCGLDVYEKEPEVHPGLLGNPNVMLLPHMGTWTVEVM